MACAMVITLLVALTVDFARARVHWHVHETRFGTRFPGTGRDGTGRALRRNRILRVFRFSRLKSIGAVLRQAQVMLACR